MKIFRWFLIFGSIAILLSVLTVFASPSLIANNLNQPQNASVNQGPDTNFELYGLTLCGTPAYKCIAVKRHQTWYGLWPNAEERELVMKLNRTNVALSVRKWLLVPKQIKQVSFLSLSPLPAHMDTQGHKLLFVDLSKFAFGAYDAAGQLLYSGPVTSGQEWCVDNKDNSCRSAMGTFKIYRMQGEDCESSKYPLETKGGAPMPYCMHYYKGYAIHGSTLSGFNNRSAGCIRLFNDDARWLNLHFVNIGTTVTVKQ